MLLNTTMNLWQFPLVGVLSFLILTFLLKTRLVALFIDSPDQRKFHQHLVPRMGGFGIITASILIWMLTHPTYSEKIFALSALAFMILGFLDDSSLPHYLHKLWSQEKTAISDTKFDLRVRYKLLIEITVAAGTVYALNLVPPVLQIMGYHFSLGLFGFPIFTLAIIGITNAYNLVDGVDGLAGSLAICSLCAIAIIAHMIGAPHIRDISLFLACAVIGFLFHNISPAQVFLGDMGSLFIGYCIATLSLMLLSIPSRSVSVMVPVMLAGLPLLDVAVAILRRFFAVPAGSKLIVRLKRIVSPDTNHLHHRLLHMGLSHMRVTVILSGLSILVLCGAVGFTLLSRHLRWGLFIYISISLFLILYSIYFRERWESIQNNLTRFIYNRGHDPLPISIISIAPDTLEALNESTDHPFEFVSWGLSHLSGKTENLHGFVIEKIPEESSDTFCNRVYDLLDNFHVPVAAITENTDGLMNHSSYHLYRERLILVKYPLDIWPMLAHIMELIYQKKSLSHRLFSSRF